MKKIYTVLCVSAFAAIFAAGSLGAQEEEKSPGFHITLSAITDAVFIRTPTGEYAKAAEDLGEGETRIYPYQGDGWVEAFQTSMFDDGLNGNVKFEYNGDFLGGFLVLKTTHDTGYTGNWDYELWTKLFGNHLRILSGNQARYSGVSNYQNFTDFVKTKVDALGVLYPTWHMVTSTSGSNNVIPAFDFPYGYDTKNATKGFATFASTATDDLFMPAGAFARQQYGFLFDVIFAPVTVSASVGGLLEQLSLPFENPWYETAGGVLPTHDDATDPVVTSAMNGGVRIEGTKIADFITVAGVYKYSNTHISKTESRQESETLKTADLIDEKVDNHTFGLYANADLNRFVNGLGVSLGYSALQTTWTNDLPGSNPPTDALKEEHKLSSKETAWFPLYSGIDLRAVYTGIPRLTITCNNNVSFASIYGTTDYSKETVVGWAYSGAGKGELNENVPAAADRKEDYLGLYNALSARYALSDNLSVLLQAANQLGVFSLTWEGDGVQSQTCSSGFYAGASYTRTARNGVKSTVNAGIAGRINAYSYQEPAQTAVHEAGYIDLGIPLEIRVEF